MLLSASCAKQVMFEQDILERFPLSCMYVPISL